MALKISRSVGNKGLNFTGDVQTVQLLLNRNLNFLVPLMALKIDGDCGPITIGLIVEFQRRVMKIAKPDGRVDPGKGTINKLNEKNTQNITVQKSTSTFDNLLLEIQQWTRNHQTNLQTIPSKIQRSLTEVDYQKAANFLGVEIATIKAVARVESLNGGFLSNGKPKILFEGHQFSKRSQRQFDSSHPTLSHKLYTAKNYKGGMAEYTRYEAAKKLNSVAAMQSTSWGMFQIMGFNYHAAGYSSLDAFVKDMHVSEGRQLLAFVNFLKTKELHIHLKSKNWAAFARGYNGENYAINKYDKRMEQAYKAYSAGSK